MAIEGLPSDDRVVLGSGFGSYGGNDLYSIGGRLYVSDATRAKLAKWKDEARLAAWKTPFGMRIKEALDRLHAAAAIKDKEARMKAIKSIETSIAPAIGAGQGKEWVKHLFLGELARVKGGEALEKAQYHFRKVLSDGEGEVKLALDRLLAVDVALRDETAIEYDALLVLRFDIRHQYANALLGSVRLERGDFESAERFLRRAVTVGVPNPGIKNDLAFALSGLGRHREAEVMIEEAVRDRPGDWHLLDTMAEIYAASGQAEKSAEARRKSETSAQQCGQHRQYRDMVIARGKKQRKGWFW